MDKLDIRDIEPELLEQMKKIAYARVKAASDDLVISVGSKEYSKKEMLQSISDGDEVGLEIIDMQIEFLRDMASGEFYAQE